MVKLDRRLVENLHLNPRKRTLVSNVVRLCGELGAEVVAEGIETVDELSAVRDAGAQYGQGYLLGRPGFPMPPITWPPPPCKPSLLPYRRLRGRHGVRDSPRCPRTTRAHSRNRPADEAGLQ